MSKSGGKTSKNPKSSTKTLIIVLIIILILAAGGAAAWWWFNQGEAEGDLAGVDSTTKQPIYSTLTGLEISNASLNTSPTFCMQIPNGSTDGARPQAGLKDAAVVFEAIAETGITRFAAIFQNPTSAIIGPIRSLRPYYLSWDTPFDCTIVHDGGSDEALAAVGNGKYRNLDEDFSYMWKINYIQGQYRYWNNVFTSPAKLLDFNHSHNYNTSTPKAFPRLTPPEVSDILAEQRTCAEDDPECEDLPKLVTQIRAVFTNLSDYIVNYQYDANTNTYLRFYEGDGAHMSYHCTNADDPDGCTSSQVSPNAIAVIRVQENTMSDGYHEEIQTIGSGQAYIFQNGEVIEGTWHKSSQNSQIEFLDTDNNIIKFTPGQLWIAAVPQFGSVSWE